MFKYNMFIILALLFASTAHGAVECASSYATVIFEDQNGIVAVQGLSEKGVEDGRYYCHPMQFQNFGWVKTSSLGCSHYETGGKMQAFLQENFTLFGTVAGVTIYRADGEMVFQKTCR